MIRRVQCATCGDPYDQPDDDPDPSHPGCAPSDPSRFGGVRRYTGAMESAIWWSVCVCGRRIEVGQAQRLADTPRGPRWVCLEADDAHGPPEGRETPNPDGPASDRSQRDSGDLRASAGHIPAPRTNQDMTSPRRAAA